MSIQSTTGPTAASAATAVPARASAAETDRKAMAAEGSIVPMELVGLIGEFAFGELDLEITQNASRDTIKIAQRLAGSVLSTLAASFKLGSESTARLVSKSNSPTKSVKVTICYGEYVIGTFVMSEDCANFYAKVQDPIARPNIYIICTWMLYEDVRHKVEHDGQRIDLKTKDIPVDHQFHASGTLLQNGRKRSNWWKI